MLRRFPAVLVLAFSAYAQPPDPLSLWYRQPAKQWVEALPVGNGRLGAMVFGGIGHERIQFNEHTVWTGEPHDYAHPGAHKYLGQIRDLLWQGKQVEAQQLATAEFMSIPLRQKIYQAFGDIVIDFPGIQDDSRLELHAQPESRYLDRNRSLRSQRRDVRSRGIRKLARARHCRTTLGQPPRQRLIRSRTEQRARRRNDRRQSQWRDLRC